MNNSHLPSHLTSFVGRDTELGELTFILSENDCRLLTLVGPGGIGKTRLAIETASLVSDQFPHGVFFVPLAPLTDPNDVVPTIINTLGIQTAGDAPREELIAFLSRRHLLLVLDNAEHLLDIADLVADILHAAADVTVLVTSREPLNLSMERLWQVRGLPQSVAMELFVERATWLQRDFAFDKQETYVVEICHLLGGMPLAIELAASWLKTLSCQEIVSQIESDIDFLSTRTRDIPERHRSIRAVFDHSWHLLADDEKEVFPALSVFRGGFTLEAAQQVAGSSLTTLSALVEKSMVRRHPDGRYDMQELVRQYADDKLTESCNTEVVRNAHMRYFADFMGQRTPDIKGRRQLDCLHEIAAEFDNIRIAWNRAIARMQVDAIDKMAETLVLFCDMRARFREGYDLITSAISTLTSAVSKQKEPVLNRLRTFQLQAWVLPQPSPVDEAYYQRLEQCLSLAQQHDDTDLVVICMWLQVELLRIDERYQDAVAYGLQVQRVIEQFDSEYYLTRLLRGIAWSLNQQGFHSDGVAEKLNRQTIEITRRRGDYNGLAHAVMFQGAYVSAEQKPGMLEECIDLAIKVGDRKTAGIGQFILAEYIYLRGEFELVQTLAQESLQNLMQCGWSETYAPRLIMGLVHTTNGDFSRGAQLLSDTCHRNCIDSFRIEETTLIKSLSLAMLTLAESEQSTQHVRDALQITIDPFIPCAAAGCLAVVVLLESNRDKYHMVALLGLAFSYSDSVLMGWMHKWQRLTDLRHDLEAELGTDAYQSAWRHGEQLDLEATVHELIAYFSDGEISQHEFNQQHLIEPLSDRELEVLRLVAK